MKYSVLLFAILLLSFQLPDASKISADAAASSVTYAMTHPLHD